jgi:hypothetical protein
MEQGKNNIYLFRIEAVVIKVTINYKNNLVPAKHLKKQKGCRINLKDG